MPTAANADTLTLFLCGDVMTGRGIDQILPHPGDPQLFESWVRDARDYVRLAEKKNGAIAAPVSFSYCWGDALAILDSRAPDLRLINLETSITHNGAPDPRKGIHYRMHPCNIGCLTAAAIDGCALANNHVMDWGSNGLLDTLATLREVGIRYAGAGADVTAATAAAVFPLAGNHRLLMVSCGLTSSGIPEDWRADNTAGVYLLPDLSDATAAKVLHHIDRQRRPADRVLVSIHWGGNWGYAVPEQHARFARQLVDGGVDIVHGHSSHHPQPMEVYRERPIFYGCGDFLNDYEGIGGHERFRSDLALMYFVTLELASGHLLNAEMVPMQIRKMRLQHASGDDTHWLRDTLNVHNRPFGTVLAAAGKALQLQWRR